MLNTGCLWNCKVVQFIQSLIVAKFLFLCFILFHRRLKLDIKRIDIFREIAELSRKFAPSQRSGAALRGDLHQLLVHYLQPFLRRHYLLFQALYLLLERL